MRRVLPPPSGLLLIWLIIGRSVATVVLVVASIATLIPATRAATPNLVTAFRMD
jgi:hypothetical protein